MAMRQITLSLQVVGIIEDRGELIDPYGSPFNFDTVEYGFQLITSEDEYMISYCNQTGRLTNGVMQINLTSSDFSIVDGTLSINFSLMNSDEVYENLSVSSTYLKADFSNITSGFVYLTDLAANPPLEIIEAYGPESGYQGQSIQFNASIQPLTGLPPYSYQWDFGDQGTSTELNPTHVYSRPGFYQYTFTVTDDAGATASEYGYITIQRKEGAFIKAFLFGSYANNISHEESLTFSAVNLRMIFFLPPAFHHFIAWERVTVLKPFLGIQMKDFLIGVFSIVSVSVSSKIPNIACTTDSTLNRLIVAYADANIKWSDIDIRNDTGSIDFHWALYTDGGVTNSSTNIIPLGKYVTAGDYLQLWWSSTGNVRISFRYIPKNVLLGAWTINV